jgi:hypothetical protein
LGTSKNISTPSGGKWTPLKRNITRWLGDPKAISPAKLVGQTVSAAGGLSTRSAMRAAGGGGGGKPSVRTVGKTVGGLAAFGADIADRGLTDALARLGLNELEGRSAQEVIARVAEHLAEHAEGTDRDLLLGSIERTILEAAALIDENGFENLEAGLQKFLETEGPEGLVELFLVQFVLDCVWTLDEQHILDKTTSEADAEALQSAMRQVCRSEVQTLMAELKRTGRFESTDWFGRDASRVGREIARRLEERLFALEAAE